MAKRKLTSEQRAALRKELAQLSKTDKPRMEILRAVAAKYSISTITARWYLNGLKGGKGRRGKRRGRRGAGRPGLGMRLVSTMQAAADRTFTKVLEAKKLIPRWQKFVKREFSLKKAERKLRLQLKAASRKAKMLHRRILELTTR